MTQTKESHTAWWREVAALIGICPQELKRNTGHDWRALHSQGASPVPVAYWYLIHGTHYLRSYK